jgi:lipopolysaccharide biosynthesis glycosyltransferase
MDIIGITVCFNYDDYLRQTITHNDRLFKKWYIITDPSDTSTIDCCKDHTNIEIIFYDKFHQNTAKFNKSGALRTAQETIHKAHPNDWVMILDADILIPSTVQEVCKAKVGHLTRDDHIYTLRRVDFVDAVAYESQRGLAYNYFMAGYCHMYFDKSKFYPPFSMDASECDVTFKDMFGHKKYISQELYVHHLGTHGSNWQGRISPPWKSSTTLEEVLHPLASDKLLYYVIGGVPKYADLLRYSINTLRRFVENDKIDILVMCDPEYAPLLHDLPVRFHLTDKNDTHIQASMRKTEIFNYRYIHHYKKVLYLDCDIVITGSLQPVFDMMSNDHALYVVPEKDARHEDRYYQCIDRPYDVATLNMFKRNDIYPFNAGQFGFVVSPSFVTHFSTIAKETLLYDETKHFYEQSFMNNYFNRLQIVNYSFDRFVKLFACHSTDPSKIIHHFCDVTVGYADKLRHMQEWHTAFWSKNEATHTRIIDSREAIADAVTVPENPIILEIGTFEGEYAHTLLRTFKPRKLHLVDPWEGNVMSGDHNGNNVRTLSGEALYNLVCARFASESSVEIHRSYSQNVEIPDASLDLIYIDGDHSYEGVARDLRLAYKWVKFGGWICGHDYDMNYEKTKNHYDFGVKRAVQEFCKTYGLSIWALLNDGCMSFVIRK